MSNDQFVVQIQKQMKLKLNHLMTFYTLEHANAKYTNQNNEIGFYSRDAFIKSFEKCEKVFISNVHVWRIKIGSSLYKTN